MRLMNTLEELDGIAPIADDLLVYGYSNTYELAEAEHDKNLITITERARRKGIIFNLSKSRIKRKEMKFVGHISTQNDVKANPEKTSAIHSIPAPHDKQSLLRFIGMI